MIALCLAGLVWAQDTAQVQVPPPVFTTEVADLPGGDTLVVVQDHRAPIVTVRVAFPVGMGSSWAQAHGLDAAWALQLDDPDGALRARADALAAPVELSVDTGGAWLAVSCLKDDLPQVVALVGDLLRSPAIAPSARVRRSREGLVAWRTGLKSPGWVQERAVRRLVFPAGHAARERWEHRESVPPVRALVAARDAVVATPGRVIGFAGDVTLDQARSLVEGLLPVAGTRPVDSAVAWGPFSPLDGREDVTVRLPKLTQVYLAWVRDAPAVGDEQVPALLVATHALGGHFYSRLVVALRHDGGQTYGVTARGGNAVVPTPFVISTFTRVDNAGDIEATLVETVRRFREEGLTDEELAEARGNLAGRELREREAPDQALGRWMSERVWGLEPGTLAAVREAAVRVDDDVVNALVRSFFDPEAFRWVRVEPR